MDSYKTAHDFLLKENTIPNRKSVDIFISRIEDFKHEIESYRDKLTDEYQEQINYCNSLLLSSDALIVKVEDEKEIFDEEAYNQVYVKHVNQLANVF
jgi:hypothetical protein